MSPFDPLTIALISAATAVAALLRAFTGFGFALVAVPAFSLLMQPTQVVVLASALALLLGLISIQSWRGRFDKRELLMLLLPAAVGTVVGAAFLPRLTLQHFQTGVGCAVLISCALLMIKRASPSPPCRAVTVSAGLLSGLLNGALAVPGPPMIAYVLLTRHDPGRSRALLTVFFTVTAFFALVAYTFAGRVSSQSLIYIACAVPVLFVANWLGDLLFQLYAGRFYRRVALGVLVLMGISMVYRAVMSPGTL